MNKLLIPVILSIIIFLGISTIYADEDELIPIITISSDFDNYVTGDTITINGHIENLADYSQSVTIVIVGPDGNIVTIANLIPSDDGNFSYSMKAGGTMNSSGEYEIRAQYGQTKITITFNFIADDIITDPPQPEPTPEPTPEPEPEPIDCQIIGHERICYLKAEIKNLKAENIKLTNYNNSLLLKIEKLQNIINK